jgi:rubredoxin
MRYLCTNCSYIYDEGAGEENVAHGTRFEELKDGFACPICGDSQDSFHEITEEISYVSENPYDHLEIDHYIETKKE